MTTPFYNLQIIVTIVGTKPDDDVTMIHGRGIQFAPWPGLVIELKNEEYGAWQVPLENLRFSFSESSFIAEIEDTDYIDSLRGEDEVIQIRDIVGFYESFGFRRINNRVVHIRENTDD